MERFVNLKPIEYNSSFEAKSSADIPSSTHKQSSGSQSTQDARSQSTFAKSAYETTVVDKDEWAGVLAKLVDQGELLPPIMQSLDMTTFGCLRFVLLDPLMEELSDVYEEISGTFVWEYFYDQNDSGSQGRDIVPKIHALPQLYCIYIHCADIVGHSKWAYKYSKVRVICNNDDLYLLPQFALDVAQANIDWGNALLAAGRRDEAKTKFEKALHNLLRLRYIKKPDPNMLKGVNQSITCCR